MRSILCLFLSMLVLWSSVTAVTAQTTTAANSKRILREGTPMKLRLERAISSKTATVGDSVEFTLQEDLKAGDTIVAPLGSMAVGTVSAVKASGHFGKAGQLGLRLLYLKAGDVRVPLRGAQGSEGHGREGVVVGLVVAFGVLGFLKHGQQAQVPAGTIIDAEVDQDTDFAPSASAPVQAPELLEATLEISSTPSGADIMVDGNFVGNSPSSVGVKAGDHVITVTKSGYRPWERRLRTTSGRVNLSAVLYAAELQIR